VLTGPAPPRRPLGADPYERIACADGPRSYHFRDRQEDVVTEHLVLPFVLAGANPWGAAAGSRLGGADPEGAAGGLDAAAASGTIEAEDEALRRTHHLAAN
jgi:hypothetical protein